MLSVVTFLWGTKYDPGYVDRLGEGLARHMNMPYRFVVVTERPQTFGPTMSYQVRLQDIELTRIKGCFARLRLFDPTFQRKLGCLPGDRILVLDLDLILTGKLASLIERPEPFVILQGVNSAIHPCKMNGSVWLTTAQYRPDVWSDFSLESASCLPVYPGGFVGDQEWFQHKLPKAAAFSEDDGVWAFRKGPWPEGCIGLPDGAKVVAFPGSRDPAQYVHLPWVRKHWLGVA